MNRLFFWLVFHLALRLGLHFGHEIDFISIIAILSLGRAYLSTPVGQLREIAEIGLKCIGSAKNFSFLMDIW